MQGTVARLIMDGERVVGIETLEGRRFGARAVVITTGTADQTGEVVQVQGP